MCMHAAKLDHHSSLEFLIINKPDSSCAVDSKQCSCFLLGYNKSVKYPSEGLFQLASHRGKAHEKFSTRSVQISSRTLLLMIAALGRAQMEAGLTLRALYLYF